MFATGQVINTEIQRGSSAPALENSQEKPPLHGKADGLINLNITGTDPEVYALITHCENKWWMPRKHTFSLLLQLHL